MSLLLSPPSRAPLSPVAVAVGLPLSHAIVNRSPCDSNEQSCDDHRRISRNVDVDDDIGRERGGALSLSLSPPASPHFPSFAVSEKWRKIRPPHLLPTWIKMYVCQCNAEAEPVSDEERESESERPFLLWSSSGKAHRR